MIAEFIYATSSLNAFIVYKYDHQDDGRIVIFSWWSFMMNQQMISNEYIIEYQSSQFQLGRYHLPNYIMNISIQMYLLSMMLAKF